MPTRLRSLLATAVATLPLWACAADDGPTTPDDDFRPDGKADDTGVRLEAKSYDVRFTNPLCEAYRYDPSVLAVNGEALAAKPKNVYCRRGDVGPSAARPESVQAKVLEWIDAIGAGDEVFLAYLSFSNTTVGDALCGALERGAKVTFVLDKPTPQGDRVAACGGEVLLRGNRGGIGYAHNKLIMVNPAAAGPGDADPDYVRLVFSSGNMSSGVVTHHENWHFIEAARAGYFAQAHACMVAAQRDADASSTKAKYRDALRACRADIEAPEEDDIKAFFIPSRDDARRAETYLLGAIGEAAEIDLGAHRFGHSKLVNALADRLRAGELTLRMVADDDLYWLDPEVGDAAEVGSNVGFEADNVAELEAAGGDAFEIRYLETNHAEKLLHHNKYLLYRTESGAPFALLAGAANLTSAGFNDNFENIYFIKVPAALAAFERQLAGVWDGERAEGATQDPPIATPRERMPVADVAPR